MTVLFTDFCNILNDICKINSKEDKQKVISDLLKPFENDTDTIFGILRLLLPKFDKNRSTYGLKEHSLGKMMVKIFNLKEDSVYFKQLCINDFPEVSRPRDYASIVFNLSRDNRRVLRVPHDLSVTDVNGYLDRISRETNKFEIIQELVNTFSGNEIKWFIRIILKEIRIGLEPSLILSAFNPNAPKLFETNNDLYLIIQNSAIKTSSEEIFSFIRPMLSITASKKLFTQINVAGYYVEEKFDGERFQFHFTQNEFKWFSRQGNIVKPNFDHLTDQIKAVISPSTVNFILDGEMVGYNPKTKKYGTKGFNYDIKKVKETSYYQPCFLVFDVLLFNNQNLLDTPFVRRREFLKKIIPEDRDGVIVKSKASKVGNLDDLIELLNESIKKDLEGIVVKNPSSFYLPNQRTSSWIKVKVDYFEGLLVDLDLLIIGGFYGEGRQNGQVATFLLGIQETLPNGQKQYISIGESGLGLTNNELQKLQYKLNPNWEKVYKNTKMPEIKWGKKIPDVAIQPKKSVILEMKASELHRTDSFLTSHTLRFPRILKVRYDKPIENCMTLDEFNELINDNQPVVKLTKRLANSNDFYEKSTSVITKRAKVESSSKILTGKVFQVLSGTDELNVDDIQNVIMENGGNFVNFYDSGVTCMLAGNIDFEVETQMKMKTNRKDVVKVDWLMRVIAKGRYEDWHPNDALVVSTQKQKQFSCEYDQFLDHYTKHITFDNVHEILKNVPDYVVNF